MSVPEMESGTPAAFARFANTETTVPSVLAPPSDNALDGKLTRPLTVDELERNAASATAPIFVAAGKSPVYDAAAAGPSLRSRPAPPAYRFWASSSHDHLHLTLGQTFSALLWPPILFAFVSILLNFSTHHKYPRGVWLFVLLALAPIAATIYAYVKKKRALKLRRRHWRDGAKAVEAALGMHLFLAGASVVGFAAAAIFGEVNYYNFMHPYYSLRDMRSYSGIDPTEVSAMRLEDAGEVSFVSGSRVVTDMAASFTTWDVYCVAPISTPAGLPTQGSKLASYDYWAIGTNCCRSGGTAYRCGEHQNFGAHSGLRLADNDQLRFFRLAVQQAEAAYGIEAMNPMFFYWVEDPSVQLGRLFEQGFKNLVMVAGTHFALNAMAVLVRQIMTSTHVPEKECQEHYAARWRHHITDCDEDRRRAP